MPEKGGEKLPESLKISEEKAREDDRESATDTQQRATGRSILTTNYVLSSRSASPYPKDKSRSPPRIDS